MIERSGVMRELDDDGHHLPTIKAHSLEKIHRHNYYARIFSTSMKRKWPQRAYLGLYSGAGRARLETTGEIIETTAMAALRLPDPFTHYIFVDRDQQCTDALVARAGAFGGERDLTVLTGDVNQLLPQVQAAMPEHGPGKGLLSFCFVDPFAADISFDTIRALATYRMDFLVLLMLGLDARVNFRRYFVDRGSTRMGDLIDCSNWRAEWENSGDRSVVRFLLGKFDEAMVRIGYQSSPLEESVPVRVTGMNVLLYHLVFYSKHPLGKAFWNETVEGTKDQLGLDL
jgi:three-Cys-motif partner protein